MKIAVCCILKNENHYVREWVEWYKNIGTTNVILYDNNDVDGENLTDVIGDYIDSGFAIVKDVRGKTKQQMPCYQACYEEFSDQYDWIAFFDTDEFLEFDNNKNFEQFLSESIFKEAEFIKVCWKNFSDNSLTTVKDGNYSITRFTKPISENTRTSYLANRSTKIIVRTGLPDFHFYMEAGGEHGWHLPFKSVDCHGNPCRNDTQVILERIWDNAWLNHYRFKTIEEFCTIKLSRLYANCDKDMGKLMLSKNDFFDYNEWTQEKDDIYHKYVGSDIVCCILNYKHDDNAITWYNRCRNNYKTFILDSYHLENGDVNKFPVHNDNIIFTKNIYFGGQTIKAMELLQQYDGKYLVTITSDVECDDNNFAALIRSLNDVLNEGNIGVWEPSANQGSMCNGSTQILFTNIHQYYHGTGKMRDVICGEGWFEVVKREVCDYLYPHLNMTDNKLGWGINDAFNRISRKLGLRVVIDDRVFMHHPAGTGYNNQEAAQEYARFRERFEELGLTEPEPKTAEEIKTLICCIGKNENRYVREYVEWYKHLGVTHIRLYDNNDPDGEHFEDVIKDFIDEGYVDIVDVRGQKVVQLKCYTECYSELKNDYDWILFIDCGDEYLTFTRGDMSIGQYLSFPQFRNYDLIHINLMTVGDNDLLDYDPRPLMERFPEPIPFGTKIAYDFPEDAHVSSIVRGGLEDIKWEGQGFTHTPSPNNLRCCNNVGFSADGNSPFANVDFQLAAFRHYTTKTAREYCDKMRRGFPDQLWDGSRVKNLIETRFFRTNKVTKEKVQIFKDELGIDMSYLLPVEEAVVDKRDDVKIFSLCYEQKGFDFLNDAVITPLQVGAANGTDVCRTKDNTGDNISDKNYLFIENTGTYWIWRNVHGAKYKGQMQYRRPLSGVTEEMDFDKVFTDYDVITCEPFHHPDHKVPTPEEPMVISADTVEQGYAFSNCVDDLYVLELIIQLYHPDYYEDYVKYIKNGPDLYYSNGFIMKEADYDRYCEFLFDCLVKYLQMANIHSPQELVDHVRYNIEVGKYPRYGGNKNIPEQAIKWQCSILGFLSERVWTLWVQHNFPQDRILKLPYIKQEEGMYT